MNYASDEKWRLFNCFLVQGKIGRPTGPDPDSSVGDQDIGRPGRPVSSELQAPSEPRHYRARTTPSCLGTSRGIFPSNYPSNVRAEISNTPR